MGVNMIIGTIAIGYLISSGIIAIVTERRNGPIWPGAMVSIVVGLLLLVARGLS